MNEAALSQIALAVVAGIVTIVVKWLDGRSGTQVPTNSTNGEELELGLQPDPDDSSLGAETYTDEDDLHDSQDKDR